MELNDNDVVISGISGRFPNSRNMSEFAHNLYNKIDMIDAKETRWNHYLPDVPKRMGKIPDIDRFDALFFGVQPKQVNVTDPTARILVEVAYEAIIDAGVNPRSLRKTNTGVYVGVCSGDSYKTMLYDKCEPSGYGLIGSYHSTFANRVSYLLGLNGPSMAIDTACSSSLAALDTALNAMKRGQCDAAIVAGTNVLLHPEVAIHFVRSGVLAHNGCIKPFDVNSSGYVRSEAVCAIFLQKAKDSKRIYSKVVYTKINCDGYKTEGISYPSGKMQQQLMEEFYKEIKIDPLLIDYIEAHGTGTVVGDPEECESIFNAICKDRTEPLLIGSVKSNMGHSEAASGVCSIAKIILAFETGIIPPNINYTKARKGIKPLEDNRLKVVTESTKLKSSIVPVNSFGFGGVNAHALLERNKKLKLNYGAPTDELPRLVQWACRTEEALETFMSSMIARTWDAEFIALIHEIQKLEEPGFFQRGYGVFTHSPDGNARCLIEDKQFYNGTKRPITWVFSGMGSQWNEMGSALMYIPIFKAAIDYCHNVLLPYGLDLFNIITTSERTIFENLLHSFVGICAIQIGLVDVLKAIGLKADYYIGHSFGELCCGYADGCFTKDQTILSAYFKGIATLETPTTLGLMAAVGMNYAEIEEILPGTIEVACHNSANLCTISGPKNDVETFVADITKNGIFAKEVSSSNVAFHSKYISDSGPHYLKRLKQIIPVPKPRSSKWLSTSVPKSQWDSDTAMYCSAEYHTENLLKPVLFEETAALLPDNALTIEIAPHGLLQSIMKTLIPGGVHIALTKRNIKDNAVYFLNALGTLFLHGFNMSLEQIYPKIKFPVSPGTPMISPLIQWDHSDKWFVGIPSSIKSNAGRIVLINLADEKLKFLSGHIVDGRCFIPATGYIYFVWESFAILKQSPIDDLDVEFSDVKFLRATTLPKDNTIELYIVIQEGTGEFEITEQGAVIVTGNIKEVKRPEPMKPLSSDILDSTALTLTHKQFYQELKLRGYQYNGEFCPVLETQQLCGKISWTGNWITFLDGLLQIAFFSSKKKKFALPVGFRKLRINIRDHINIAKSATTFLVKVDHNLDNIIAAGVEIIGVKSNPVIRIKQRNHPIFQSYQFIQHHHTPKQTLLNAIKICVQLTMDCKRIIAPKVIELNENETDLLINLVKQVFEGIPMIVPDLVLLTNEEIKIDGIRVENRSLTTEENCFILCMVEAALSKQLDLIVSGVCDNGYLISRESKVSSVESILDINGLHLIAAVPTEDDDTFVLYKKTVLTTLKSPSIINVSSEIHSLEWLDILKVDIKDTPVILVARNKEPSGILGLINCLNKEPNEHIVRCVFIYDDDAPEFQYKNPFYYDQLKLGLAINVFRNGAWGSYRHIDIITSNEIVPRTGHYFANVQQRGDLSSVNWLQGYLKKEKDLVRIQYAALNFKDVMLASGRLVLDEPNPINSNLECDFGLEYAGVNENNERVMGITNTGSMATEVISIKNLTWKVPDNWSLQDAASCPVVYATVYWAFFMVNPIKKGKSILIHSGSGGIGLAAIRVALAYEMIVFTTVSSSSKRSFLLQTFPQLKDSHIGNSRDCSFETMIAQQTSGKGVDFVLNSLSGDKLHASIRCLSHFGTFLEIGRFDVANDNKISLGHFLKAINFATIYLDNCLLYEEKGHQIYELIENGLNDGTIQPITSTVFEANEIEKAFRYMTTGNHIGKILVKVRDDPFATESMPIQVIPRIYFDPELVYIIVGGLGGIGLELTDWLLIRGARKIVLNSRRGISNEYQSYRIRNWTSGGAEIKVCAADVSIKTECERLFTDALDLGPIGGIFNLAMVLKDAVLQNQSRETFQDVLKPKAVATQHLDELSREMCPHLKHFVVFSSVSCGLGTAGQTNYGMANSIMERIIEKRISCGLPGKAIQFGPVEEVGIIASRAELDSVSKTFGFNSQPILSVTAALDTLLSTSEPITSSIILADSKTKSSGADSTILESVLKIIGIHNKNALPTSVTLSDLGTDSLTSMEIEQTLGREFGVVLKSDDLNSLTLTQLEAISQTQFNQKNV